MAKHIQIEKCPRCDGKHEILTFFEFKKNFMKVNGVTYTHWAYCPRTLEPVLVTIEGVLEKE